MSKWYYVREGQQGGPIYQAELMGMVASGRLKDSALAWRQGMEDWKPIASIPELAPVSPAAPRMSPTAPNDVPGMPAVTAKKAAVVDPYSSPVSSATPPPMVSERLPGAWKEIPPGSHPIELGRCISRSFELVKRHFGTIILVGLVYIAIVVGLQFILEVGRVVFGLSTGDYESLETAAASESQRLSRPMIAYLMVSNLVSQLVALYLGLGVTRIGLNIVSGQSYHVGMIFGEGSKLLRTFGASILYGLMVSFGLLLLIIPGIYLALRYGHYQNAIVDRDLGVFDALSYSSSITTNSRLPLFGLWLVSILIVIAGALALLVGLIFAYPLIWLAMLVAYRWMQYGSVVTEDQPA